MSHPAFTDDDKSFIRAILTNPAELTGWLVYADWLDEHDDPIRAEFLRLEVRRGQLRTRDSEWSVVEARLRELRESLDPDWLMIFDRPNVENCDEAFAFKCPKKWENLRATADNAVRHCTSCQKLVYYCRTLPDAQDHARQGHCVAVKLGVLRYPGDLESDEIEMGDFLPSYSPYPEGSTDEPAPPPRRPWWKFW
jgi:uncharacterized protein (TIGR02996 family)